ncbi:NADH-quinone oxidoreductase subunit J [bacterium]|nr:NADH-quinone oxidoreductase subunit J [bacterium]MBU1937980.1 NADH-quinone oxidoreductase subunit J [bacterium]
METILFILFALGSIISAILVITTPAPINSALYLVVTFFCLAGFYVLLAAPLLAALQIIVYAGAVLVLIIFVIMLLNLQKIEEKTAPAWKSLGIIITLLFLGMGFMMVAMSTSLLGPMIEMPEGFGKVATLGELLFTKYLYPFEVVSVLLLLAIIGAVALIRKQETE